MCIAEDLTLCCHCLLLCVCRSRGTETVKVRRWLTNGLRQSPKREGWQDCREVCARARACVCVKIDRIYFCLQPRCTSLYSWLPVKSCLLKSCEWLSLSYSVCVCFFCVKCFAVSFINSFHSFLVVASDQCLIYPPMTLSDLFRASIENFISKEVFSKITLCLQLCKTMYSQPCVLPFVGTLESWVWKQLNLYMVLWWLTWLLYYETGKNNCTLHC